MLPHFYAALVLSSCNNNSTSTIYRQRKTEIPFDALSSIIFVWLLGVNTERIDVARRVELAALGLLLGVPVCRVLQPGRSGRRSRGGATAYIGGSRSGRRLTRRPAAARASRPSGGASTILTATRSCTSPGSGPAGTRGWRPSQSSSRSSQTPPTVSRATVSGRHCSIATTKRSPRRARSTQMRWSTGR